MALTRVNALMFSPEMLFLLALCGGCSLTAVATEGYLNYRASLAQNKLQ